MMTRLLRSLLAVAIVLIVEVSYCPSAFGQNEPPRASSSAEVASQHAAREKIFGSERWRRANRALNEWLSVQQVYRPEQVAAVRAELNERALSMSPSELEEHLKAMEQRLQVLLSPEAADARQWLEQFLAVARNPEQQLGRNFPDVLNMSASEIRQELRWLEKHRASRQQSHAAFNQTRAAQVQTARNMQAARRETAAQSSNRSAARIGNRPAYKSQYAPQRELTPAPMGPLYKIGPWGTPIYWHPQNPWW
jgi:hypothetical protein